MTDYVVKELKYKDLVELTDLPKLEQAKKLLMLATGMTEEQFNDLSLRDGIAIQKQVNDLNGLGEDFQKPLND